jgi:putative N6-adenine-specific DNA methylase
MNEVLAAGIVLLSGWDGTTALLIQWFRYHTCRGCTDRLGNSSGRYRNYFGFQKWTDYNEELFNRIGEECGCS